MAEALVALEREGEVATVLLNRPEKLNALSTKVEAALTEVLADPLVATSRAIVFAGSGRAFSSGADLTDITAARPESVLDYYRTTGAVYERIASLDQPTVAAIHGYCLGGGFELALATDVRIAERSAVFGFPELEVGVVPGSGGILRVTRMVGTAVAREVLLLSSRLEASRAAELGLVTELVADGHALGRAQEVARKLAELPPIGVEIVKRAIDTAAESPASAVLLIEQLAYGMMSGLPHPSGAAE